MSSYQKGFGAYDRGDYDTALKEWWPLAEQGNVKAQYVLGIMYEFGRGVPQDYQEAARLYQLAANRNLWAAWFRLGGLYEKGQGVPQDRTKADWQYMLEMGQKHFPTLPIEESNHSLLLT